MKLYYSPGACSLSPHIVLCEAGLAFELEKVDLSKKRTASGKDFLTINPKGYVPALKCDNGEVLTEGPAIVQYVADLAPQKQLAPAAGSFARYHCQEWLNFISTEIHKAFGTFFKPNVPEDYKKSVMETLTNRLNYIEAQLADHQYLMGVECPTDYLVSALLTLLIDLA